MRLMQKNTLLMLMFLLSMSSCMSAWTYLDSSKTLNDGSKRFSVVVPSGWVQANVLANAIAITKDGPSLQWVVVTSRTHADFQKDMDFKVDKDTLPSDLSKYYIARFKKDNNLAFVDTSYDGLKTIDGNTGFELHIEHKNERGLRYKTIAIGFLDDKYIYELTYSAPVIEHFDQYSNTFQNLASSFKRI